MINISRVINDKRITQTFTAYRKSGSWIAGRWVQNENPVQLVGVISIAKERDIQQVPEGDRVGGEIAIYSTQALFVTQAQSNTGTSDEVMWQGDRYRLFSVKPYIDYGYYKAIGIRMTSD
jgi:hypothetical protein